MHNDSLTKRPLIHGWRETVLCVADIDEWAAVYQALGDWSIVHTGQLATDQLAALGIAPPRTGREMLLGKSGAQTGLVRLISLDTSNRQPVIRSFGRPWETGGWFDLNARVGNIQEQFEKLQDRGWSSVSDPIEYDFGPFTVKEWLAYGPDGVVFALIERINPPLAPDAQPGSFGMHFNSTQIVTDITAARHFYQHILGFKPSVEITDEPMMPSPRQNVLGVPNELAATQPWNISMLLAPGNAGGSVEIISLPGLSGRDFAPLAKLPNRGIIGHRFPVDNVQDLHAYLVDQGVEIISPPRSVDIAPYGKTEIMAVRGPCGARLDFFTAS
jgi:catechol 2,3-dioxygenase-like lactoylglutathione lyase family enzyme